MKIYTKKSLAYDTVHPGKMLSDELKASRFRRNEVAKALQISAKQLQALCRGEFDLTPEIAAGLECLGIGIGRIWLELQAQHNRHPRNPSRGGVRIGAGRKAEGVESRQIRITAPSEQMQIVNSWLAAQPNAARAVAQLITQAVRQ